MLVSSPCTDPLLEHETRTREQSHNLRGLKVVEKSFEDGNAPVVGTGYPFESTYPVWRGYWRFFVRSTHASGDALVSRPHRILQGKYAKADPLYERAIAIMEKSLGPRHPLLAAGLESRGELLTAQVSAFCSADVDLCRFRRTLFVGVFLDETGQL